MKLCLASLALVLGQALTAQTLYWIGGSGNWTDPTKWSTSSGGPSCACVPTQNDNVVFDTQSGFGPSVTINAQAYCKDMIWTGGLSGPTMSGNAQLDIYGSMTLAPNMGLTYTGDILFRAATPPQPCTITTAANILRSNLTFNGAGGSWTLMDALQTFNTGTVIDIDQGTLNTNGMDVFARSLEATGSLNRGLILGSSTVTLTRAGFQPSAWSVTSSNLTFSAGNSRIVLTASDARLAGGGLTYFDLDFTAPTGSGTTTGNNIFHDVSFAGNGTISGSNTFQGAVSISGDGDLSGSNTFNGPVSFAAGRSFSFNGGTTQTFNSSLSADGTCATPTLINGGSGTAFTTFTKLSGSITINQLRLNNVHEVVGLNWTAFGQV